jgi:broad specificity phosphatase PhoE
MAVPLLRERVYTASDTGRPWSILEQEFPSIDFDECKRQHDNNRDCWWYTHDDDNSYQEWRPHGEGQWYAVPGEPEAVFDARIQQLDEWLAQRKETKILIVSHWGVFRHMTKGTEWKNAEAKLLEWEYCHVQKKRLSCFDTTIL